MAPAPRSRLLSTGLFLVALASCREAPPQPGTVGTASTASVATGFELDHAIRPFADVALSLDGKRVRDAAVVTNALDAMKAAPETARKLEEIEKKCKLSLLGIWDELRFSAKRSLGEGITYIRLSVPAESVAACIRSLWTDLKAADIAGHSAWIIPGEGAGAKPLWLVTSGNTLILGTESFMRDALSGAPADDIAAHALARQGDELGRGLVTFDDGSLTKVVFRITATGDRFELVAEPDLEDEPAATAFIALLEKTWTEANAARVAATEEELPRPHVKQNGSKVIITAKVEGDATKQSRYLSGVSALGFSAFQRFVGPTKAPTP